MIRGGFVVRALLLSTALAAVATPATAQAIANCKVAYVDGRAVLFQTPGYAQADSIFQREMQVYQTEVAKLQGELQAAAAKFEETSVMLSASNRTAEREKLETQQDALDARREELTQKAAERRDQLISPIEARITAIIEGLRAENDCAMIFDVAVDGNPILAADKSLDLTARVVARLRGTPAAGAPAKP